MSCGVAHKDWTQCTGHQQQIDDSSIGKQTARCHKACNLQHTDILMMQKSFCWSWDTNAQRMRSGPAVQSKPGVGATVGLFTRLVRIVDDPQELSCWNDKHVKAGVQIADVHLHPEYGTDCATSAPGRLAESLHRQALPNSYPGLLKGLVRAQPYSLPVPK